MVGVNLSSDTEVERNDEFGVKINSQSGLKQFLGHLEGV
jgi:hypothetical protein